MKSKKILAIGLVVSMMASMAIGVSASSTDTAIKEAVSGSSATISATADIDIEGIIEPTLNTLTDGINPTDPSKTSDVISTWDDDVVDNTCQLLVTAPTKMKFVVRGNGTDYGTAGLVAAEVVSGNVRNASAYIPANAGTVVPKTVSVSVNARTLSGTAQFSLQPNTANQAAMQAAVTGDVKGSVKGIDLQLGSNPVVDFGSTAITGASLGKMEKGSITSVNSVYPSDNTIKFVQNAAMYTCFDADQTGRLVNNYVMGLTFSYNNN